MNSSHYRIAYLAGYGEEAGNSLRRKIDGQMAQWRSVGHEGKLFQLNPATMHEVGGGLAGQAGYFSRYLKRARQVVSEVEAFQPDLIYSRYFLYSRALVKLANEWPSVIEVNADDLLEYRGRAAPVRWLNLLTRGKTYRAFDRYVSVTNEIMQCLPVTDPRGEVIANGVPDADILTGGSQAPDNERPLIGFIGSVGAYWHGYEELVAFADANRDFDFLVIGQDPGGSAPNLTSAGAMPHAQASEELKKCDVAFSTLGLFRKGLVEACPLKSRQYLGLGLPMVTAYPDPDLPGDLPFVLELPNEAGNLMNHKDKVREFILAAKGHQEWRDQALNFARETLANSVKETRRLSLFEELVGESTNR